MLDGMIHARSLMIISNYLVLSDILKLVSCCHLYRNILTDINNLRKLNNSKIKINNEFRQYIWYQILNQKNDSRDTYGITNLIDNHDLKDYSFQNYESSPQIEEEKKILLKNIKKDVFRTCFRDNDKDMPNLLKKMLFDALVQENFVREYVQGMNYLAYIFLKVYKGQLKPATSCFKKFLFNAKILDRFENDFALIKKECKELFDYVKFCCPNLNNILDKFEISLDIFTFPWQLLYFSYEVSKCNEIFDAVILIFDAIIMEGSQYSLMMSKYILKETERLCISQIWGNHSLDLLLNNLKKMVINILKNHNEVLPKLSLTKQDFTIPKSRLHYSKNNHINFVTHRNLIFHSEYNKNLIKHNNSQSMCYTNLENDISEEINAYEKSLMLSKLKSTVIPKKSDWV